MIDVYAAGNESITQYPHGRYDRMTGAGNGNVFLNRLCLELG
jgi:hypothetical protein